MFRIPKKARVRINGIQYTQVKIKRVSDINKGDLVIDTKDNCYGYIDQKNNGHVAIKHGCVVEVGVPINRIRKLIPSISNNQSN